MDRILGKLIGIGLVGGGTGLIALALLVFVVTILCAIVARIIL